MRVPLLFRPEQARAAADVVNERALPTGARVRYIVNQLVGTRLCRAPVGRLLRHLYAKRGVPSWDLNLVPQPTMDDTTIASLFFGTYESAELILLKKHFGGSSTVIELGSSQGVVAAHVAAKLAPGARMICVEPNAALIPSIIALVAASNPDVALHVEQAALADAGVTEVAMDFGDANAAHVVEQSTSESTPGVPTTTLSEVISRHGVTEYSLVCDIEGSEASLLFDDEGALAGCRELLIELHPTRHDGVSHSPDALGLRLRDLGFSEIESVRRSSNLTVSFYRARRHLARAEGLR